jgi:hippurate hydrolase
MKNTIQTYLPELISIRQDLHKHPELGFEEVRTSGIVAGKLQEWGIEVHTGWATTGVVGVISKGTGSRTIALRADMDALAMTEKSGLPYSSVNEGIMHSCGHDGHVTMLLGAARYLAGEADFDGTVVLIFQPAEEGGGGGRIMTEGGLFEEFGVDAVYGLHNRSGLEAGCISTRTGGIMAATDNFDITITGRGTHAALPHTGTDPIPAASELALALGGIIPREIRASDSAVLSITRILSGTAYNIIPDDARLSGCTRYNDPEVGRQLRESMERTISGVAAARGCTWEFEYTPGYPVLENAAAETQRTVRAAEATVGMINVDADTRPMMASEDFAFMARQVPGSYIFLGNGEHTMSHRSDYDFNDRIIALGVEYWVNLVYEELGSP